MVSNLEKKFNTANIIAIVVFAVLIIVAIWSAVQVVKYAPRALEGLKAPSLFSKEASIKLQVNNTRVKANEEFKIYWNLKGADGGNLAFMYACADGVAMDVFDSNSGKYITLACNVPYNMPITYNSLKIKMRSSNTQDTSFPIAIVYIDKEGKKIKDILNMIVAKSGNPVTQENNNLENGPEQRSSNQNDNKEGVANTQENNTENNQSAIAQNSANNSNSSQAKANNTANKCISKPTGTPDLKIFNVRVGSIAPNGYFYEKSSFAQVEPIVVKFYVSNAGNKTSPSWYFDIASNSSINYSSEAQPAIAPCSGRIYTVSLKNIAQDLSWIRIQVDPSNLVHETNEANNNAIKYISVF